MRLVRLPTLLLALCAALLVSACGQEAQDRGGFQTENAQLAETEAIYLTLDDMKYQVQVSRQLNPMIGADRDYFDGVAEDSAELADDELWFGVWMRVENEVDEPVQSVEDFEIHDSQENVYRPVEFGPGNPFSYRSSPVEGKGLYPDPDSPAGERQPYGSLVLFKLRRFSLDNRPLELILTSDEGEEAIVSLDA